MKITKRQLRKIIKESLLLEAEMLPIIVNEYEDVEDYNILANYAHRNDMQGALQDPTLQHYIKNNEVAWLVDDSYGWLKHVGKENEQPAPEGWDLDKIYDFVKRFQDTAWKEYQKLEDAAIAADPDREFLEFLGNQWTSTISPDDMPDIKWKEYKKYIRLKPPRSISHGVGEINVSKENIKALYSGAYEDFMDFLTTRAGGQLGRRAPYKKSPPPIYD